MKKHGKNKDFFKKRKQQSLTRKNKKHREEMKEGRKKNSTELNP